MKKTDDVQMLFDFKVEEEKKQIREKSGNLYLRRAAIAWLLRQNPTGIGVQVPTRFSRFQAEVAAFWSVPGKGKVLVPIKTVVVETRNDREQCWPDCSKHEDILPLLKEKKEEKRGLEAEIRKSEPELKDTDSLFNEYENWDYEKSKNKKYHKCLKRIEELEHVLYKGSRFEKIRRTHVADFLYLAVPAGTVHSDELADGWGLLNINKDMSVKVLKKAESWECSEKSRFHLVQNIAMTCLRSIMFVHGIHQLADGSLRFIRIPKRRHY